MSNKVKFKDILSLPVRNHGGKLKDRYGYNLSSGHDMDSVAHAVNSFDENMERIAELEKALLGMFRDRNSNDSDSNGMEDLTLNEMLSEQLLRGRAV
ncbi:putative coil containing protein [Vibrio phage 236O40-1]|nr:putative coil containing protein [Vibrio phage 236O40-1]